jgi:hypothetical protein
MLQLFRGVLCIKMTEQELLHIIQEETEKVVQERKLKKSEKAKLKNLEKKVPKKDFKKRYGKKKGIKVYYATLTNMAKVNEEELDERCQKGYKTHETRKTKKMYGKTYRNCVKAEQLELDEKKKRKKKKKKAKKLDRCARIAKRKYKVWPSAYASGAAVKCRQGKIWKGVKEEVTLNEAEDNLPAKIRKALVKEGGAAGMKALKEHTDGTAKDIKKAISGMDDVGLHEHGDYILHDGKEVHIKKTKDNE